MGKPINKRAVRSAMTTLKKNGLIQKVGWVNDDFAQDFVTAIVRVPSETVMPKKRFYIRKPKKSKTNE